ncbi:MAG: nuclear transport factor 2 family protein [Chryseolinea sp.]
MIRLLVLILVSVSAILVVVSSGFAQSSATLKPLPIQVYEKIWRETDSEARMKLIKTIWIEESTYEDPSISIKGLTAFNTMVDGFYKTFPGATLVGGPILGKDNFYTWSWKIFDANKRLIVAGRDFVEISEKGQILKVIGFFESQNQEHETVKVVAKYFECLFKTRDFKTMSEIIAPGALYNQAEGLPYGGTFVGFENWTKMFTHASDYFDLQIEKEPTYFTAGTGDGVLIQFTIRCIAKKSGKIISMPVAEHFDVKGGLITGIRPYYFDTKKFSEFIK